jgi:hypothetical protein
LRGLDRIEQVIAQPRRLHIANVFAETLYHAEFVGLDPVESGKSPERYERDYSAA